MAKRSSNFISADFSAANGELKKLADMMKEVKAAAKMANDGTKGWSSSLNGLSTSISKDTKLYDLNNKKLTEYKKQLKEIEKVNGKDSKQYKDKQAQISKTEKEMKMLTSTIQSNTKKLNEQREKADLGTNSMQRLTKSAENAKDEFMKERTTLDAMNRELQQLKMREGDGSAAYQKMNSAIDQQRQKVLNAESAYSKANSELNTMKSKQASAASSMTRTTEQMQKNQQAAQKLKGGYSTLKNVLANLVTSGINYAWMKLKQFATESVEVYKTSEQNNKKLEVIMKQRMKSTKSQISSMKEFITTQSKLGVVSKGAQTAGAQQLATFVYNEKALKNLIPAMNNLVAQQKGVSATGKDAYAVANMMGKVMTGSVSALKRVGVTFNKAQEDVLKNGTEMQRSAMLAQVITDNVGKMNEKLAKTDAGKLAKMNNNLNAIKSTFGEILLKAESDIAEKVSDFLASDEGKQLIEDMKKGLQYLVDNVLPPLMKIVGFILGHLREILPIIGALMAMNIASKVMNFVTTLQGASGAVGGLSGALGALSAHPIVLVIAAIVAVIVLLWTKCKWFRDFWKGLWDEIVYIFTGKSTKMQKKFEKDLPNMIEKWVKFTILMPFYMAQAMAKISSKLIAAAPGILKRAKNLGANLVKGMVNGIKDGIGTVFKAAGDLAGTAISAIKKKLGIHSPSRVARGLLQFFGQGAALGLDDSQGIVSKAAGMLGDTASSSLGNALTLPKMNMGDTSFIGRNGQGENGGTTNNVSNSNDKNLTININGSVDNKTASQVYREAHNALAYMG